MLGEPVAWLARPPRPITRFAARIHRITDAELAGAPAFADIGPDVRRALAGRALVGHNAHVDVGVLRRELGGWQPPEVFDTLKLARRLLPGQPSYKLGALVTALALNEGLPAGLAPHRASYDVLVTARLFVRLATGHGGNPVSLEELRGQAGNEKSGSTDETAALF